MSIEEYPGIDLMALADEVHAGAPISTERSGTENGPGASVYRLDARRAPTQSGHGIDVGPYDRRSVEDAHVAARVVDEHLAGRYISASGLGWMTWTGTHWQRAPAPMVTEAVRRALGKMHAADSAEADAEHRRAQGVVDTMDGDGSDQRQASAVATKRHGERMKAIGAYFRASTIRNVVSLATGMVTVRGEDLDGHPELLNTPTGVVDLRTGALASHDPALMLTRITRARYAPDATHRDWDKALTALDPDVAAWLQVRAGQAATGYAPPDDVVPFLQGGGANGKSSVVGPMQSALGHDGATGYSTVVPASVLMSGGNEHPTEMMGFRGARLCVAEELPDAKYLDSQRLKTLAGTGHITARAIGQDYVTWVPSHSLFISTNFMLRVAENDYGTWRRMALVRFTRTYRGSSVDETLRQRLSAGEGGRDEAVLAWLVAGARQWFAADRTMPAAPASVTADTAAWRADADPLARFLDEVVCEDSRAAVRSSDLYEAYSEWAKDRGVKPWSDQTFWARLAEAPPATDRGVAKVQKRLGSLVLCGRGGNVTAGTGSAMRLVVGLRFLRADEVHADA